MSMVEPCFDVMLVPARVTIERRSTREVVAWIEVVWPWHEPRRDT